MTGKDRALHDWTLQRLTLDWCSGLATLQFLPVKAGGQPESIEIRINECHALHVPRGFAWGRSASVLEAMLVAADLGFRLDLQMQSGDLIMIAGAGTDAPVETSLAQYPRHPELDPDPASSFYSTDKKKRDPGPRPG